MAEELKITDDQSSTNNDHIITLYENMETLMSGFKLVLNIITKHENLLNNISNPNVHPNIENPVICEADISVGANEDISAISNVVPNYDNLLCYEQSESTNSEEHSNVLNPAINDNNYTDTNTNMFDEIPSINTSCLSVVVDPVFPDDIIQSSNELSPSNVNDSVLDSESVSGESCYSNSDSREALHHLPYEQHDKCTFHLFNVNELEKSTNFDKHLGNRSMAYYGEFPYSYSNIVHTPKPYTDNVYLTKLLNYVEIAYPNLRFNSAMVTRYTSGDMFIPQHSDSEPEIEDDSSILTLSFGETRTFEFLEKNSSFRTSVVLNHGDALLMTKRSQRYFSHGIPTEANKGLRVSVTLRLMKEPIPVSPQPLTASPGTPLQNNNPTMSHHTRFQPVILNTSQQPPLNDTNIPPSTSSNDTVDTIYISSSMFRYLNPRGMSSRHQNAKVFFYPGANSAQMINRLFFDPEFKSLAKNKVTQVFLLTGTNNVDAIYSGTETIYEATKSMSELLYKLWMTFEHARLNIINVLPREHNRKNEIVQNINKHLYEECKSHGLKFIDTEIGAEPMFTLLNGSRDNTLFSNGFDNVHMNSQGYSRIARYLKYLAHI